MGLGNKITQLRKEHQLSQEAFAEQFNVTRQTVSNWENEKSSPDLETLVKISETFNISVDDLLKNASSVEEITVETKIKAKNKWWLLALLLVLLVSSVGYFSFKNRNRVNYQLQDEQTLTLSDEQVETTVATGHFRITKDGPVTLEVSGSSDSGKLTVQIIHNGTKETIYETTSDNFNEEQRLSLVKGTYDIQITANEVQEQVLSVTYDVSVKDS